ncbi:ankyrin repeat domain-containing protein [Burkholderia cenocepacia]|uniref:Ankyrin repeat domain-containing protein n=1 Tax=Burkholderia cenocepacia TaxID=95486 RepID=A0ABD4UCT1_9BURK|nr:ankyrin repeat domain-containing protein [Burkholderia cenocepacia]MCW3696348.1 ankyrin repeat domain-containing protein [Burkholderia cenocepacia]MCW3704433.1 ankyrin repeat domain-containing protein [Burkholderia cenocepacia]MCW3712128.1 ankyrin repeat domain-containing protein [Burkholderia cenocepacia]MCW3720127.1 ankyrin repeat domain-containing protein [Burkholderia cenocepacia]MCW3727809.1 ankyrin repeat domain-containing protein [Burkholderia cenocepacia]
MNNVDRINRAIEKNKLHILKKCVFESQNVRDEALTYAAYEGRIDMLAYLLSIGANPCANYSECLNGAAMTGQVEAFQYLMNVGAEPTAAERSGRREQHFYITTPISWAVSSDCLEIVKMCLEAGSSAEFDKNDILRAAARKSSLKSIEYLLREIFQPETVEKTADYHLGDSFHANRDVTDWWIENRENIIAHNKVATARRSLEVRLENKNNRGRRLKI